VATPDANATSDLDNRLRTDDDRTLRGSSIDMVPSGDSNKDHAVTLHEQRKQADNGRLEHALEEISVT